MKQRRSAFRADEGRRTERLVSASAHSVRTAGFAVLALWGTSLYIQGGCKKPFLYRKRRGYECFRFRVKSAPHPPIEEWSKGEGARPLPDVSVHPIQPLRREAACVFVPSSCRLPVPWKSVFRTD